MPQSVLIVDDSLPLHALIKTQLKPECLKFHSAYNGEAALLTASSFRPDLILLDVDMPGLNGFDVCRRLKANPLTSSIHVIFLTGESQLADKVTGLEAGGADYIAKPFKPEELKARVRAVLREKRKIEETMMVDPITGLWNRTYFELQQKSQLSLAKRTGRPVSCIVIDVNRWSSIIAKSGEAAGHEIMRALSKLVTAKARAEDVVCRVADGEIAMLLSGVGSTNAAGLAERLRTEIDQRFQSGAGCSTAVTCSAGVADSLIPSKRSLLEQAQTAAGSKKHAGHSGPAVLPKTAEPLGVAA